MTRLTDKPQSAACFGRSAVAALLLCAPPAAARAQIMLPGATNGVALDHPHKAAGGGEEAAPAPLKPIAVKVPEPDTILGQALTFDGAKGVMRFSKLGEDVVLAKLTLPGERLSKPGEACEVDIVGERPIVAVDIGRPAGTIRWSVAMSACPLTVDILDGAALVSSPRPACDFTAADCRVNPIGLWGPAGDAIPPERVKALEHERVRAETTMRSNFRTLLRRAGKDKAAVKAIAGAQAAFSSEREMTCRDYAGESVHGFCSTQITQARSLAILAQFAEHEASEPRKKIHHAAARKPPAKPMARQPETPAVAPEPGPEK